MAIVALNVRLKTFMAMIKIARFLKISRQNLNVQFLQNKTCAVAWYDLYLTRTKSKVKHGNLYLHVGLLYMFKMRKSRLSESDRVDLVSRRTFSNTGIQGENPKLSMFLCLSL